MVFPVIDMILAVLLFVKIATAYMDYRKHGQFDFTAPAILFACLLFRLTPCRLALWTRRLWQGPSSAAKPAKQTRAE